MGEATGVSSGGVGETKIKAELTVEKTDATQSGLGSLLHPSADGVEAIASSTSAPLAGTTTAELASGAVVVEPLPPVPSTSLQFVADWKEMRGQEGRMLAYFQVCVCLCVRVFSHACMYACLYPKTTLVHVLSFSLLFLFFVFLFSSTPSLLPLCGSNSP